MAELMTKPVERIAPDAIRLERMLDAPAETVWRHLTEGELRGQWFAGGSDVTGEGPLDLVFDHDNLSSTRCLIRRNMPRTKAR